MKKLLLIVLLGLALAACGTPSAAECPPCTVECPPVVECPECPTEPIVEPAEVSTDTSTPEPTEEPTETVEPTPEPTETVEPSPTKEPAQEPTDTVEQYGYLLSAVTAEDPTTPGRLYTPKEGKKLVAIEIIVGNVSGEPLHVNPLDATLVDSEGFTYEVELGGRDGQLMCCPDLSPGEKVKGWVAFEIPEGATPATIKFEVERGKFLQVGVTE